MSIQQKVAILLAVVSASALGVASSALAGEGGAAGSAAFTISEGSVTGVAVSAAIGKQDAYAGALNSGSDNVAFALGSAGTVSMTGVSVAEGFGLLSSSGDPTLGVAQANTFAANTTVQIGTGSGDDVVIIAPAE